MCAFEEEDLERFRRVLDVNLGGVVHISRTFMSDLLCSTRTAHLINVSSLGGLVQMPFAGAYCASKHAVVGLSESLRAEFASRGVRVSVVCPGPVRTAIAKNSEFLGQWSGYQSVLVALLSAHPRVDADWLIKLLSPIEPQLVAAAIADAVLRRSATFVLPLRSSLLATAKRLAPTIATRVAVLFARQLRRSIVLPDHDRIKTALP
jgi:short-subunit dehydrogenase